MTALVIGTHGKFSEEILRSSEMIFGKQENIATATFEPGESPDDLVEKYKNAIEKLDCTNGLLFLVDIFGGSPFNAASRIVAESENMDILTGVNLPMLLEIYGSRSFSTVEELIKICKTAANEGIKSFNETMIGAEDDDL